MPITITGYQYGDQFQLIGSYDFPDNEDQEAVHLPPRTTLKKPPQVVPEGSAVFFDVGTDNWVVREFVDPIEALKAKHQAELDAAEALRARELQAEAEASQVDESQLTESQANDDTR
jgi:hypothetical protein